MAFYFYFGFRISLPMSHVRAVAHLEDREMAASEDRPVDQDGRLAARSPKSNAA